MKKALSFALAKSIIASLMSFVLPLVVLEFLDITLYGKFVQTFLTVNFISLFGGGLNLGVVKVLVSSKAKNKNHSPVLEQFIWSLSLLFGVTLFIFSQVFILLDTTLFCLLLFVVLFTLLTISLEALLKADNRFQVYYVVNSLFLITRVLLVWFFLNTRSEVISIGFGYLLAIFIYYIVLIILNRRYYNRKVEINKSNLKILGFDVLEHSLHSLIRMSGDFFGRYLLIAGPGLFLNKPEITGALDLAAKFPQGIYGLITSSYPVLLNKQISNNINAKNNKDWTYKMNRRFLVISSLLFLLLYLVGEKLYTIWLGIGHDKLVVLFLKYFILIYWVKGARDHQIQEVVAKNRHGRLSIFFGLVVLSLLLFLPSSLLGVEFYLTTACVVYVIRNFIIFKFLSK